MKNLAVIILVLWSCTACNSGENKETVPDKDSNTNIDADSNYNSDADMSDEQNKDHWDYNDFSDLNNDEDTYVVKEKNTHQWGTTDKDRGSSIAVDLAGNIYVTGVTEGAFDGSTSEGMKDIFLTKFNSDFEKLWTKQWGTNVTDESLAVKTDREGNVFVTGYTFGDLDGNLNFGRSDLFLTKFNNNGIKQWTKLSGSYTLDYGESLEIDDSGNVFTTGYTLAGSFDENLLVADFDIIIIKWTNDGEKIWTRQLGTEKEEKGTSVAVDKKGNIFILGQTRGNLDENKNSGGYCHLFRKEFTDCYDIFLTKFNSEGVKLWTKQWGDRSTLNYAKSITVDSLNNLYIAETKNKESFLTKIDNDGTKKWIETLANTGYVEARSVAVDRFNNVYMAGSTTGELDGNNYLGFLDLFITKWSAEGTKIWTVQWGSENSDEAQSMVIDFSNNIYVTGATKGNLDGNVNEGGFNCDSYICYDVFLTRWK